MRFEAPQPPIHEVFAQYLSFERVYNQSLRAIGATVPGEYHHPEKATLSVGRVVLDEVGKFGTVEPFKSDWQGHVFHWSMIRAYYKGESCPFDSWEEYMRRVERDWIRHDGLADHTIVPVVKEVMTTAGLWTDAGVRALTVASLVDRGQLRLTGSDSLREHFMQLAPEGFVDTKRDAVALIGYLADNAAEMHAKRPIGFAREISTERDGSNADEIMPDGFVFMDDNSWDRFLATPTGRRLGLFSTVNWFTEQDSDDNEKELTEHHKTLRKTRDFIAQSLQRYVDTPEYKQFVGDPYVEITKALIEFNNS